MSTPNPLIPQGSFQAQAAKGASNVRIAVATIIAIHVVFFGGLLLQGCKRDTKTGASGDTNATTNLSLPPIDSAALYSTNTNTPSTASGAYSNTYSAPVDTYSNNSRFATAPAASTNTARDLWPSTNLTGASSTAATQETGATKEYTVVRGDSFGKIAHANHTTVAALRTANPDVDPAKIKPGMKINVPVSEAKSSSTSTVAPAGTEAAGAPGSVYTVKAGDNLTKIACAHGVTVSQLRAANNLKTSRVGVGQKLKIPAGGEGTSAPASAPKKSARNTAKPASTNNSTNLSL